MDEVITLLARPKAIKKIVLNSWHIKRLGSKTVRVASSFVLLHKNPKLFVANIPLNLILLFPWSANNKLIVVLRCSKTIEPLASEVTLQHSFLWMMAFHSSWLWEQSGAEHTILHQQHWWDLCQVSGWVSPRHGLMGCSWVGSWVNNVNMVKWRYSKSMLTKFDHPNRFHLELVPFPASIICRTTHAHVFGDLVCRLCPVISDYKASQVCRLMQPRRRGGRLRSSLHQHQHRVSSSRPGRASTGRYAMWEPWLPDHIYVTCYYKTFSHYVLEDWACPQRAPGGGRASWQGPNLI